MSQRAAIAQLATSPREAVWLAGHVSLLAILPVLIRFMPLPVLLEWLTPSEPSKRFCIGKVPEPERIVAITDWLLGQPNESRRPSCMKRSLALYRQLRRGGQPVELCLGVRRDSANTAEPTSKAMLHGHAWLARGDEVLYEGSSKVLTVYAETYRFPPRIPEARRAEIT